MRSLLIASISGGLMTGASACAPHDIEVGSNLADSSSSGTASTGSSGTGGVSCAATDPGLWKNITPPQVSFAPINGNDNYGVRAVTLDPSDPSIVYFTIDYQGIWRSSDCGGQWTKINTGPNGDVFDTGIAYTLVIDPTDSQVMYSVSAQGAWGIWKSIDRGASWAQLFGPGNVTEPYNEFGQSAPDIYSIDVDPLDHQHLIASFHGTWAGSVSDTGVLETSDGGSNWKLHMPAANMGMNHQAFFLDASARWLLVSEGNGTFITKDAGASFTKLNDNTHIVGGGQIYKSGEIYYYTGNFGLFRSADHGDSWTNVDSGNTTQGIVGNGSRIFTSNGAAALDSTLYNPMRSAPEVPGDSGWAPYGTATFVNGGNQLVFDHVHNILYSSAWQAGLLRISAP